jgi:hypothetical protein
MDLPVWQALYNEIGDRGFVPIAVAFETRGPEAARPWIEAARPGYPALIDQWHVVADLYGMLNVPIAVWINEEGRIVRPPEPAGSVDAFRRMDHVNYTIPPEAARELQTARGAYLDALRDWVANGERSRFVLSPEEVRRRMEPVTGDAALAATEFRLGEYLYSIGRETAAQAHFAEAKRLEPESWAYKRQAWNLEDPLKSGGPEFWAAVDALGDAPYYKPVPDIGGSANP